MRNNSRHLLGRRRHLGILLIVASYLVIATIYSVANPIFEASDEFRHYPLVKHLADGKGLPDQSGPIEENVTRQEGSQPPLYHALSALATFWIDTGDIDSLLWLNPHATIGIPLADGNKNLTIHSPREDFPYRGPALAVHIIRWLSILMGAAALVLVYTTTLRLMPSRREVALGATALVAFNPQFAFVSASVNNDILMILLASLVVFMLIALVEKGFTFRQSLILGLALGLALLTKLTALGLIPLVLACLAFSSFRQRSTAHFLSRVAVISLISVSVAGWWYTRNWMLYGDPTGLNMMLRIVGSRVTTPSLIDLLSEFEGFRISFWAIFGAVNVLADGWIYRLLDGMVILAIVGLIVSGWRNFSAWTASADRKAQTVQGTPRPPVFRVAWDRSREWLSVTVDPATKHIPSSALMLIPLLWLVVNFGAFVRWTQTTNASAGRLIFPAITGIAMMLSLGLASLVPRRISWLPLSVVGAFLLVFSALAPFRYIAPAYTAPHILTETDIPASILRVNATFGESIRLIGYSIDKQQLKAGDEVKLTLYWQGLASMNEDYSIFISFMGRDGQRLASVDTYPGLGSYPTRLWKAGDIFFEEHRLSISSAARAPALVQLAAGMYTLSTMDRLPAYDERSNRFSGDAPILAELRLLSTTPAPSPAFPLANTNFADSVELVGYDLGTSAASPGESLKLTLYWKALRKMTKSYTVFTQLLSPQDLRVGQHDSQPMNGQYPTRVWDEGEVVADEHTIQVQGDSPPGRYRITVGMYLLDTNERLRLAGPSNPDHVTVGEITINQPR